jgi:hypothetical protein
MAKVYDCKLWLEDGMLKVRGYVAFFYPDTRPGCGGSS